MTVHSFNYCYAVAETVKLIMHFAYYKTLTLLFSLQCWDSAHPTRNLAAAGK